MKLSRIAARKAASVARFSWAVLLGFSCAQGEDLSSAHKDAGRGGAGGGFATGAGGSAGSVFLGLGGSSSSTGGSTGTGGFIGVGGSSASGGSSGSIFTGTGGTTGAGGAVFLGIGGSTSTTDGGAAGMAGGGSDFDGPVSMGLQAGYHSTQASQIAFSLEISNNGVDSPAINTLKIRYYFSDESFTDASSIVFDYAAWNGTAPPYNLPITTTCKATLTLLQSANPSATSYFEFGCDSPAVIAPMTDKLTIQVRSTSGGEDVTNDYSYTAGDGSSFAHDDHLVIYQGATVAFGTPP